ncbi:MAG: hypothetical protein M5T52_02010 [Ignavibacteriaceae bacterium]|nr:hypothetical protein [Ignavibacteriaceae bacterium]
METKTADLSSLKIDRSTKSDKPSNKGKYIVTIIVALAIIAAIIILYPIVFSKTIEVKLTSVMLQSTAQTSAVLTASGYVVAQRQASVSSKGTGVMVYLGVVEGDKVKKDK